MRQALFAVVLVAASFAGGAAVNGPGLRWAQTALMGRLGLDDRDEPPKGATTSAETAPSDDSPGNSIPPLPVDPSASKAEKKPAEPATADAPAPRKKPVPTRTAADVTPTPAPARPTTPSEPRIDRGVRPEADEKASLAAFAADVSRLAEPTPGNTDAPADPTDWAGVRKALRDLGVARYGTEGEPGGRVRFHCVIPLAGRRAVGQHFEAEGDDEFLAARAALRRVALWRASGDDR